MLVAHRIITSVLFVGIGAEMAQGALQLTGVNLCGAEFGSGSLPGVYAKDYIYPKAAEVDYFVGKGMNVFRLPFRWERLQRTLGGELDAGELGRIQSFIDKATSAGARVILDPHNSARYGSTIVGTGTVTNAHFADFWQRLATLYKGNNKVIFGLVNEPHGMPSTEHWVDTANGAIAAIRAAGANNLILVPGNGYSGGQSWGSNWYGTPNAVAMLNIVDPGNNYAFEVHQYLDSDSSGTTDVIMSAEIGAQRLRNFTDWAKTNNKRAFLGEFAVANSKIGDAADQIGDEAIANMLAYMESNADVWLGWSWWAAGPWWNNYMFSLEPTDLAQANQADRPAMAVLTPHLAAVPEPTAASFLLGAAGAMALRRRGHGGNLEK